MQSRGVLVCGFFFGGLLFIPLIKSSSLPFRSATFSHWFISRIAMRMLLLVCLIFSAKKIGIVSIEYIQSQSLSMWIWRHRSGCVLIFYQQIETCNEYLIVSCRIWQYVSWLQFSFNLFLVAVLMRNSIRHQTTLLSHFSFSPFPTILQICRRCWHSCNFGAWLYGES